MGGDSLRIICGPTAAGKSALALELAMRHRGLIISADSRQIYKGFDIGTAKPSAEERMRVPHRGIDTVLPTDRYSASRFADDATRWLAESNAAAHVPVVVGGTGFYLRALVAPLFEEPPLDEERRHALSELLGRLPVAELRRWCESLDPERAHLGRAQLLRTLEITLLTGRRLTEWHRAAARPPRLTARYLLVDPGRRLHARIEERVDAMLAAGWEGEVRRLASSVPADSPAWKATGYRAIRELVEGGIGRDEARRRVVVETRQYAKRQRTWFRHQLASMHVTRLDPHDPDATTMAERWWSGEGNG